MNRLALVLADRIRAQIVTPTSPDASREVRLVFLGPPHELMAMVFDDLANPSGGQATSDLPFLLQVSRDKLPAGNPAVGKSGWCDEDHLLDLRNLPRSASYVALITPGEHSILSVGSTTDKFGVARSEEHTSELQALMSISHAAFCLKKKI